MPTCLENLLCFYCSVAGASGQRAPIYLELISSARATMHLFDDVSYEQNDNPPYARRLEVEVFTTRSVYYRQQRSMPRLQGRAADPLTGCIYQHCSIMLCTVLRIDGERVIAGNVVFMSSVAAVLLLQCPLHTCWELVVTI